MLRKYEQEGFFLAIVENSFLKLLIIYFVTVSAI